MVILRSFHFLAYPFVLDGKMMGMLGVANREGGYSSGQQADLEAVIPAIMQVLQRHKSESDLREAYENLKLHSTEL
jgi:GAF domain-containing protein